MTISDTNTSCQHMGSKQKYSRFTHIRCSTSALVATTLDTSELDTIQQVYSSQDRYVTTATETDDGISISAFISRPLGLAKPLNYAPASTISALLSQCSAVSLWLILSDSSSTPAVEFQQLVDLELVGFRNSRTTFLNRLPLGVPLNVTLQVKRYLTLHGNLFASQQIKVEGYFDSHILAFAMRSKV